MSREDHRNTSWASGTPFESSFPYFNQNADLPPGTAPSPHTIKTRSSGGGRLSHRSFTQNDILPRFKADLDHRKTPTYPEYASRELFGTPINNEPLRRSFTTINRASAKSSPVTKHDLPQHNTPPSRPHIPEPQPYLFEEKIAFLTHSPQLPDEFLTAHENESDSPFKDNEELYNDSHDSLNLDEAVSLIFSGSKEEEQKGEKADQRTDPFKDELKDSKEIKKLSDDEEDDHSFEGNGAEEKTFKTTFVPKATKVKFLCCLALLMVCLSLCLALNSFPFFTCHHTGSHCYPQLTIQLTDKSPAAKNALVTVREALKVLTYLAIDFGDNTSELDLINTRLDTYYQNKVIDTFSVNTVFQLNILGYCRVASKNSKNFCMKSYGLDLLSVFVRDAGVQLADLTKTNSAIMGDSFAIAYELAIAGFNEFSNKEQHDSVEYVNYAILLQKFSKGLGFLTTFQFGLSAFLLTGTIFQIFFKYRWVCANIRPTNLYKIKKWFMMILVSFAFCNMLIGFLICSLTFEYILRLSEVGQNVGIANVNRSTGFTFIWVSFILQTFAFVLIIFLSNGLRKKIF